MGSNAVETILVLHTSDTHLGYRQYGIIERERDFYDVFDEIIDIALREHVDIVVHSGDMFDSTRPPPQAFRAAIKSLRRLAERGIPFVVLAGDHDTPKRAILSPLAVLEDIGLVKAIGATSDQPAKINVRTGHGTVIVAGVRCQRGVAAHQKLLTAFKQLVPDRDKPTILLLHQSLREVSPDYELELAELPRGYSYYALGHIHVYREFKMGDAVAVYPGSPEVLRVDEAVQQERFTVVSEIAPHRTVSHERIKLSSPRPFIYEELEYRDLESFKTAIAQLREKLVALEAKRRKKPLLYMKLRRVPRGIRTNLHQVLDMQLGRHILDYKLQIETVIENAPKQVQTLTTQIDLEKLFEAHLGSRELAELALKLIDILSSAPKQQALYEAKQLIAKTFGLEREAELL